MRRLWGSPRVVAVSPAPPSYQLDNTAQGNISSNAKPPPSSAAGAEARATSSVNTALVVAGIVVGTLIVAGLAVAVSYAVGK